MAEQPGTAAGEHKKALTRESAGFALRIVLVAPRNPLNIGAAARAMSNFGFAELRLVNPYDRAFREARSAIRSRYILEQAQVFEKVGDAVGDSSLVVGTTAAARRDLHVPLCRLESGGALIHEHLTHSPAALLFGSEKFGLSNEDMSHCHWLLRIPTREEHGSMNLGQAVAVCLYELRRSEAAAEQPFDARFEPRTTGGAPSGSGLNSPGVPRPVRSKPAPASAGDNERVTELLLELLARSGYTNERTSRSTELKMRRLVRRLGIRIRDAETWLGILRQILWKMRQVGGE